MVTIFSIAFGTLNYKSNLEILTKEWESLGTQIYLFYSIFFYPASIGIIVSKSWAEEHRAGFKHMLSMPISKFKLVISKALASFLLAFISHTVLLILFVMEGKFIFHFQGFPDILGKMIVSGLLSIQIIFIASFIATIIKSFSVSVGINLMLVFFSMFIYVQNIIKPIKFLFPYIAIDFAINNPNIKFISSDYILMAFFFIFLISAAFILNLIYFKVDD